MSEHKAEKYAQFLRDLTTLSREHGVVIGGCGCCGSPFLSEEVVPDAAEYRLDADGEQLALI